MDRTVLLNVLREYDAALRANGATGLYVFGSRARGTERPDSDLDLFIDYDPAARIPNMFASCESRRRFYAASGFLSPSRPATRFIRS
jgi:predicted nucleotidyltransferase